MTSCTTYRRTSRTIKPESASARAFEKNFPGLEMIQTIFVRSRKWSSCSQTREDDDHFADTGKMFLHIAGVATAAKDSKGRPQASPVFIALWSSPQRRNPMQQSRPLAGMATAKGSRGRPQSPLAAPAGAESTETKQTTCRSGDCEGFQRATAKPFGRSRRSEIPLHNHAHHAEMLQKHNDTFAE